MQELKKYLCPDCGKWLFSASAGAAGIVEIFCKRCKRPVKLNLSSKVQ